MTLRRLAETGRVTARHCLGADTLVVVTATTEQRRAAARDALIRQKGIGVQETREGVEAKIPTRVARRYGLTVTRRVEA